MLAYLPDGRHVVPVGRGPGPSLGWSPRSGARGPGAVAGVRVGSQCHVGYSTGKITGRATNTVPVPVNTVPVAVRVRWKYPRVVGSIGVVSVQELCPKLPSLHP